MSLSCADGKHVALWRPIHNQGFDFGHCGKCGHDLVRSRRVWRAVPEGFRVVWRRDPPGAGEAGTGQLKLNLLDDGPPGGPARARPRLAVAAELAWLGLRGLTGAMAERARLWLRTRPQHRVVIAGALGPPAC